MAKRATRLWLRRGGLSLWLMMIEVEVPPTVGVRKPLRVLDTHIGAVESACSVTPTRGFVSRAIRIFRRPRNELQFLEKDRSVGKYARFLVYRV